MTEPAEHIDVKIDEAGAYDLEMDVYHGDCCTGPSISNSSIKQLLADPSEYWRKSPLNPDRVKEASKRHFNIGTSAHLLLLEPDTVNGIISVIPNDLLASNGALSTKAAKEFKATQEDLGRVVITEAEWNMVCDMADVLSDNDYVTRALVDMDIEKSLIWPDEETGVFLKTRPDVMPRESGRYVVDYKTTDFEMIESWEKQATADVRLDIQAAMQMWGCEEAAGIEPRGVLYVVQCKKPPHRVALRFVHPRSILHDAGRHDLRRGINIFAECWESGHWPSPWDQVKELTPPDWRLRQIERQLEDSSTGLPHGSLAA